MQEKVKQYSELGKQLLIRAYNAVWNAIINLFKTSPIKEEKITTTFIPGTGPVSEIRPFPTQKSKKS